MLEGEIEREPQASRAPDWGWYDLAAEERLKRRLYFVVFPIGFVVMIAGALGAVRLLGPRAFSPTYFILFSMLLGVLVELVPSPTPQTGSMMQRVRRRAVYMGLGAALVVLVLGALGLLPE